MIIMKDKHRFELTVDAFYHAWLAVLREYVPGRLHPTLHLLRVFDTRESAIEGIRRRWRVLFPDQGPLVWHDASVKHPQRPANR